MCHTPSNHLPSYHSPSPFLDVYSIQNLIMNLCHTELLNAARRTPANCECPRQSSDSVSGRCSTDSRKIIRLLQIMDAETDQRNTARRIDGGWIHCHLLVSVLGSLWSVACFGPVLCVVLMDLCCLSHWQVVGLKHRCLIKKGPMIPPVH